MLEVIISCKSASITLLLQTSTCLHLPIASSSNGGTITTLMVNFLTTSISKAILALDSLSFYTQLPLSTITILSPLTSHPMVHYQLPLLATKLPLDYQLRLDTIQPMEE